MAELVEQADSDEEVFNELDAISIADWLTEYVSPRDYPELHAVLSSAYRGEYGLEPEQQSVLNLLYLIGSDEPDPFRIFGESDERYHANQGSQAFCDELRQALGDAVHLGMRLLRARRTDEGAYILTFENQDGTQEVEADHVVFALPFTALREVDLRALELPAEKQRMIDELGYGTNAKVIGAYRERVWRVQHNASGSVTSDGPMQQCWDSSPGQPGEQGILTNFLGGEQGVECGRGSAEEWYTSVLLAGVEPIFPGAEQAYVEQSAVRMHWPTHPFTKGSYACYRPGQWAFWSYEGEPVGNLYFCGEHTSLDFQGYMEGAAETGARAAGEVLERLEVMPTRVHQGLLQLRHGLPRRSPSGRPLLRERRRVLSERIAALLSLASTA
jgi:monoamine oxidase